MVSIIVPVYRSEQTLERCVYSLCRQTYQDIEIILIVDGPPDASGILAEKLAEKQEKVRVVFQENQGVSVSRNRGIQEAKGKYIRFVDSDDYVEENSISCMVKAMEQQKTDLVIAGYHHHYFGRKLTKLPGMSGTFPTAESAKEVFSLYETGFLNMPWNKLYRKEDILEKFPTDLNLGEDLCFNLHYLQHTRHFTVLTETVCEYIQDDRGTTLSTKRRMDKLPIAFRLYHTVKEIFDRMYPKESEETNILESKLVVEFLDDMEGLAFDAALDRKQKRKIVKSYEQALVKLKQEKPKLQIQLKLLDYQIIYFFYSRHMTTMTLFLIWARSVVVKALKRR